MKAPIYKPSNEDVLRIKAAASREACPYISVEAVLLEPGIRSGPKGIDINIRLVTEDEKWNDTDLFDYGDWAEFRKGVALTENQRGVVDFYIRRRNDACGELLGNVTIEIEDSKLARIFGYGRAGDYFNAKAIS